MSKIKGKTKNTPVITKSNAGKTSGRAVVSEISHNDIARRAYEIYVKNGYQQGQSQQNWQQAEEELRNKA